MNNWIELSGINESRESEFKQFAAKRYEGAKKIAEAASEKGGPALLTRDHFLVKLPYYEKAKSGVFDKEKSMKEYSELCSKLESKNIESMEMKSFQELLGRLEVIGELIIQSKSK